MATLKINYKTTSKTILVMAVVSATGCQHLPEYDKETVGTAGGTAAGAVVGNVLGRMFGNSESAKIIGTVGGGILGGWLGKQFGAYLDERDRLAAADAMEVSVRTGREESWSNSDSGVSGTTTVVETTKPIETVPIPVLKDKVQQVPPMDLIGEPYEATQGVNVRGGPGTDYIVAGSLAEGETVVVAGKVKGQNWYMISQDGAGSGFVYADYLTPAPAEVELPPVQQPEGEIIQASIEAERKCRTVTQNITLADGTKREEQITACQGPNGWERVTV